MSLGAILVALGVLLPAAAYVLRPLRGRLDRRWLVEAWLRQFDAVEEPEV
jgi:hypothetical protein